MINNHEIIKKYKFNFIYDYHVYDYHLMISDSHSVFCMIVESLDLLRGRGDLQS